MRRRDHLGADEVRVSERSLWGIDIIAHRDELDFEPPIIKIQCKQILASGQA